MMNEAVKAGEVFQLKDLVPYKEGAVNRIPIIVNDHMKFMIVSMDEGQGLPEHVAAGDAVFFALEGEAVITYDGRDYPVKAGDNFHFAKDVLHSVAAKGRFKMAVVMTLE